MPLTFKKPQNVLVPSKQCSAEFAPRTPLWGALQGKHCEMQARGQLEALKEASEQLQASTDFMTLLQAVLALGNHLNKGTMRGAASGALPDLPLLIPLISLS